VKARITVQVPAGGTGAAVLHVPVLAKSVAFAPPKAKALKLRLAVPLLVMVRV
jgi:hypothetical protein